MTTRRSAIATRAMTPAMLASSTCSAEFVPRVRFLTTAAGGSPDGQVLVGYGVPVSPTIYPVVPVHPIEASRLTHTTAPKQTYCSVC
jgi:hypothetical protein